MFVSVPLAAVPALPVGGVILVLVPFGRATPRSESIAKEK